MDLMWGLADTLGQRPRHVIWETLPARDTADWYPREATDRERCTCAGRRQLDQPSGGASSQISLEPGWF